MTSYRHRGQHTEIESVPATSIRPELIWVVSFSVLLIAIVTVYLAAKPKLDNKPPLLDWQLSAFYDLNNVDQAIYNSLLTAVDELWWLHGDMLAFNKSRETVDKNAEAWPSVEQLSDYYFVAPFARNIASEQHGNVQWQRAAAFSFEGVAVYFGSGGSITEQSSYLLVLSHAHKGASYTDGATIWINADSRAAIPITIKQNSLIINGWRQVMPYSGAMEVERLKGDSSDVN